MLYLNGKLLNTRNTNPDYEHASIVKEYHKTIKECLDRYGENMVLETRIRPHPDKITGFPVYPGPRGVCKRTTLIDEDGNAQEWIWSPTTLAKKENSDELMLTDPNLLIVKGSFPIDVRKTPDLVYYLLKSKKVGKTDAEGKKYHFFDQVAKSKTSANKRRREAEVAYKIFTAIPENNIRTLAKSWGIGSVDTKDIDVVREELYTKVEADEKSKKTGGKALRGYDEFLKAVEVRFDDKVAALCMDAKEDGVLVYDAEGRKWLIAYKDAGVPYILKELGGEEVGDPLRSLVEFLMAVPGARSRLESAMNRPSLEGDEPLPEPAPEPVVSQPEPEVVAEPEPKPPVQEFPLTFEDIRDTYHVMKLRKWVRDYTGKPAPKEMKKEEAQEILFQALAASKAQG